jgi:aminoglycoside phosphotransferase (APT) family kinase protein
MAVRGPLTENAPQAGAVDPAVILTGRLEQLRDRDHMKLVLQRALDELSPHPVEVQDFEITYCKVKPWRDVSIALSVTSQHGASGKACQQLVSGAMWPSVDEARSHWRKEVDSDGHIGRVSAVLVPEMSTVLRLFPADSILTSLMHATDRTGMSALLSESLPECRDEGWRMRDLEVHPVHYKPGRLCTLRYSVTLDHPETGEMRQVQLFGKAYRDERWEQSFDTLATTWAASQASGGAWRAARPIVKVAPWKFVVQSGVAGERFRQVLADLTPDDATPEQLRQVKKHLESVARAVWSMQQAPLTGGPRLDIEALLAAQRRNLDYLHSVHETTARELERLRAEIERVAAATPASPLVLSHGDFAHGNVMLNGNEVGIIDFDRMGQAEPAYDVAYFLTHLTSFTLRHPKRAAHMQPLCEHFRSAYLDLAPSVSPGRLALYEALDLSAYVLRNFRKQSHQARWLKWATGQIDSAWERLDHATRVGRTRS